MDLNAIISAAADDADEFLAGVKSMTEARPAIREYLKQNHPGLAPADVLTATAGLLAILDEEGFFEATGTAEVWDDTGLPERE